METLFMGVGALVVISIVIRSVAEAIRKSGVEEFSFQVRFKGNEKPPKQLNK
jgi:hypothetical protein